MKSITKYFFVLITTIFFASCRNQAEEVTGTSNTDSIECIIPAPPVIERATWLIGEWADVFDEGKIIETWERTGDSTLSGKSYTIISGDTVFSESIVLQQRGEDLFYMPAVSDQNEGKPVEFKLTIFTDSTLVFENPEHNFPQKISYINYGGDSLLAEISGLREGKVASEKFPMKRVK